MSDAKSVLILAGPSGVGKTTVMNEIMKRTDGFSLVRSATTREKRNDGNDGEYIYTTRDEFMELCRSGDMLEFTEYSGNYYGTPYSEIKRIIDSGKTPLLILDVNGVRAMKKRKLDFGVYSVYLFAPLDVLSDRLGERYAKDGEVGLERYLVRMKSNLKDYKSMRLYQELFDTAVESLDVGKATDGVLGAYGCGVVNFSAEPFLKMAREAKFSFN